MIKLKRPEGLRAWLIIVAGALAVFGVIWGFIEGRSERLMEAERERPVKAAQRVSIANGEVVITLDATAQKQSGIETTALRNAPIQEELRAYGTVVDLQQLTELSNTYAAAKAQVQVAQAKLTASHTAFTRAQKLFADEQNMSAAQFEAAEAAFRGDAAGVAAAEAQLRSLTATAFQSWGPAIGRAVTEDAPILRRLIDRRDILIQVNLLPGEAVAKPPQTAFAQADNGGRTAIGLISPATKTDPRIQGLGLFYTAPADVGLLPGMSVVVYLPTDKTVEGAQIPGAAVVWWQGRAWVYLRTGPATFTRREIATDIPAANGGFLAKGLPSDVGVVTQGAQMLLSEEFRAQIQVGE